MQDYNYIWGNCIEITLELSCCKYPYRHELPRFWAENKKALLVYLGQVHRGARGLIMDTNSNLIPKATLKIKSRNVNFKSSSRGEYWRILLPGVYTIEVYADGYHPIEKTFTVTEGQITNLNIQVVPVGSVSIDNVHEVTTTSGDNLTGNTNTTSARPTRTYRVNTNIVRKSLRTRKPTISKLFDDYYIFTNSSVSVSEQRFANSSSRYDTNSALALVLILRSLLNIILFTNFP